MNDFSWTTLPNGMRLAVLEQPDAPVVTMNLVFRAGCAYEQEDQQGYAHLLEHMLLKGTKARPSSMAIGKEIDRIGAFVSANTGATHLTFVMQGARDDLPLVLNIVRDDVTDSLIDPAVLENEKKVIGEEFARSQANTHRMFYDAAVAALFSRHPSALNSLGSLEAIGRASREDLIAYWRHMIVPQNATLLIVGGISANEARTQVEEAFKVWPISGAFTLPKLPPVTVSDRGSSISVNGQMSFWMVAYPSLEKPLREEFVALEFLRHRLNVGYSSLLRDELRTKRGLVYEINAYHEIFGNAFCFFIDGPSQHPEEAASVVQNVIKELAVQIPHEDVAWLASQFKGLTSRAIAEHDGALTKMQKLMKFFDEPPAFSELLAIAERMDTETLMRTYQKFLSGEGRVFIKK
ncbi:MAG: pitrilysin family protein [Candidatus Paceibacterota bacterium]|nr:MAG: pitrilysin family protein [Candidatus Paceibacterota bacterium]